MCALEVNAGMKKELQEFEEFRRDRIVLVLEDLACGLS
jgi:hypothetical protein